MENSIDQLNSQLNTVLRPVFDNKMFVARTFAVDSFQQIGKNGVVIKLGSTPVRGLNDDENRVGMLDTFFEVRRCPESLCVL